MDVMDSGDESYDESMSTDMLEDIRDGIKSHPSLNRRETCYRNVIVLNKEKRNRRERYYLSKT